MITEHPTANWDERPNGAPIDMLVVHYTGMPTAEAALSRLTDPTAKVSAHWLIGEDGVIFSMVPEALRAWHAGVSFWRGATCINARSIGIELVNPGHEFGYRPFPERQMAALLELATDIVTRHSIPARNVVGHADVAPRRKMDPGELFDWRRLARTGVGLWPEEACNSNLAPDHVADLLACIGYEIADILATLRAFQRHFRPESIDGRLDSQTAALVAGLADLCASSSAA